MLSFSFFQIIAKKQMVQRWMNHCAILKKSKLLQSLSLKLVIVNVVAISCAVGLFFFLYTNRYAFFEFLLDYHIWQMCIRDR